MIIIDTNVLLAFLLTDSITRRIIAENRDVFMSPEHCFEELWAQGSLDESLVSSLNALS